MAQLSAPLPFGKYELLRRIGAGGMGEVFLARKHGAPPGEVIVIKKILPHLSEDQGFVGRFVDEAKVVVLLNHPNICRTFDMGEVDGQFFMAMEYVEGKTLAKAESRLREMNYSFPVELALWVCAQTCDGLAQAHRQTDLEGKPLQVVHRDVSPSNIMVTYEGEVKIIDWGAALSTLKEEMTAPRVVIGNLSYMAPEHARKQHVDPRADIFSMGVVLWELLTWQLIPADGDPIDRWKRAARPNFQKPSFYRPDLPKEIDAMVTRALATEPRERFPDAGTFRDELMACLHQRWPQTSASKLGAFMRAVFQAEVEAERAIVAEVVGTSAHGVNMTGTMTGPVTDPFDTSGAPRSDPMPAMLDLTQPGSPALGRELSDPAARATVPGRPPIDLAEFGAELSLPSKAPIGSTGTRSELSISTDGGESTAPQARPMQRTPTNMKRPLPTYVWAAVGVGLGFFLVGLVFVLMK